MAADLHSLIKWLHILSATLLFGTGLGTAYYMWSAHRSGDPRTIGVIGRLVVRADWLFTLSSGIAQPITGYLLIRSLGLSPRESWLVASYLLYGLAFACWAPVVRLQIRATRLAASAAEAGTSLPPAYFAVMRRWFILGWPAFLGLLGIFWLMIEKPTLW